MDMRWDPSYRAWVEVCSCDTRCSNNNIITGIVWEDNIFIWQLGADLQLGWGWVAVTSPIGDNRPG
jgi:hypothetical protein